MSKLQQQIAEIAKSKEKGVSFNNQPVTDEDVRELCNCKSLINVGLEGTKITDKALEYLATLPKLKLLWLAGTKITGAGFVHFENHPKLDCLGIEKTNVNDDTLQIIAKIPKLNTLLIDGTKITFEGLLTVADNKKLDPISKTKFTPEQMELFRQTQRNLAKKKTSVTLDEADIEAAKNRLLAFFEAMTEWERFANANFEKGLMSEITAKVKELYQKYATQRHHNQDRYSWSGMDEGTYGEHKITDIEIVTKNKLYIYTKGDSFQYRFLMIRQEDNSWRVDDCQRKRSKWETMSEL